jgi:hypothetical protein
MRSGGRPPRPATPADYERVLRPIYGFFCGFAEAGLGNKPFRPSERAWRSISGRERNNGKRIRQATAKATLSAGIPATVWLLNRLVRADFEADLSPASIARSGIAAAAEMCARLQIEATHVVTGHTHRAGPEEHDGEWPLSGGGRLHNTGSWVFADALHHPGAPPGPYWPGTVTWVGDDGPPQRVHLLSGRSHSELRAAVSRATRQ